MAQIKLNAYDADVYLPAFVGLKQDEVSLNPDLRFAAVAENVETPDGVLQPRAPIVPLEGELPWRVDTMLRFHRRYYQGDGSKDWLVAAAGGKLYQRQEDSGTWEEIDLPDGVDAFKSSIWSWVTYEINIDGAEFPIDVLIISNSRDGMYVIVPSDANRTWGLLKNLTWGAIKKHTWNWLREQKWMVLKADTKGNKFSVIERYEERIWGGGINGKEDYLYYSAPYDPLDWEANTEIPEDGAGEIMLPSWDGDMFTTLKAFGDQLIAFKERKLWRITGTNPGEFDIREQYGGGAPYPKTVVTNIERILMADIDGTSVYDGMSVSPYAREMVREIWKTVNVPQLKRSCAVMFRDKYYLAIPTGNALMNNCLLIYDMKTGAITSHTGVHIDDMMATDERVYVTSTIAPWQVRELHYDSWEEGAACGEPTKWQTPWIDFGRKDIQKGGFDLYFLPEVQDSPVKLIFSVQTEKKIKTKQYTVQPLTEEQREAGRQHRGKRLHFGGSGRRFRLIIQTEKHVTAPWRLIGGLHLIAETDPD